MARWQTYHLGQVERAKGVEETTKNYNNEFLIVYARDLISSVPSDQTVATNVAQRMIAAVSALGHAVLSLFFSRATSDSTGKMLFRQRNL